MSNKIVLVDIDNTISDSSWRQALIAEENWDSFHAASTFDKPINSVVGLVNVLSKHYTVIAHTGRTEKFRKITMEWLCNHRVEFNQLWMRPNHDYRPAHEIKLEQAIEAYGQNLSDHVSFIIDDDERVIEAYSAMGVPCLQVWAK